MAAVLFMAALVLSITGYSRATYCVCIDGAGETALQQDIDYACGAGADCSAILQNGACYQPNTVKSHCDYAVNNYFQKMGQVSGSCNFTGTATLTNTLPTTVVSGCTYPASPSQVSAATPSSFSSSTNSSATATGSTTFGFAPTGADSATTPDGSGSLANSASAATFMIVLFSGLLGLWA